jgi:ankyrin repeat protein
MAQKRANFNIQDNDGYTPAHYAAINNYRDSLQALRDGGANFNIQDNDGYTPAHYAAINNHRDSLQALRDGGANFNIQNDSGKTVNDLIAEKELV